MTLTTTLLRPSEPYFKSGTISAAELMSMLSTPVLILGAPGVGKCYLVDKCFLQLNYGDQAFLLGGNIKFQYGNTAGGGGTGVCDTFSSSVLTTSSNNGQMQGGTFAKTAKTNYENQGIYLTNSTLSFTTGDGTATYMIWYTIVNI